LAGRIFIDWFFIDRYTDEFLFTDKNQRKASRVTEEASRASKGIEVRRNDCDYLEDIRLRAILYILCGMSAKRETNI